MGKVPDGFKSEPLPGLTHLFEGKVRDTYDLPGHPELLLPRASDRISIFDFVLPGRVSFKGQILNAMNVFWRTKVFGDLFPHDLMAFGSGIRQYLPADLAGNIDLQTRAVVVKKFEMSPVEAIVRGHLTGSGWPAYQKTKMVCGHRLPDGLHDGSLLPFPIFTPTTKAEVGHDEHIDADWVVEKYGFLFERRALQMFLLAREYAIKRGIILVDTKFECSVDVDVADEVLTPDSSRFWEYDSWVKAQGTGKVPPAYDKQFVREWGKSIGIDKRDPEKPDDVSWVHSQIVPQEVLDQTTRIYRYIFWRLVGQKLETFQKSVMDIPVSLPKISVEVILGSASDFEQAQPGIEFLKTMPDVSVRVHICSCHRNPGELSEYVKQLHARKVDAVIAGAGMAAALPGILKSLLVQNGLGNIPVLGIAFAGKTELANQAAKLSIEQLPGKPVELDLDGQAYFGPEGMKRACIDVIENEFLPKTIDKKDAQFNITF